MWPFIWQTHGSSWSNHTKPEGSRAHANNYHMNEHCAGRTHVHTPPDSLDSVSPLSLTRSHRQVDIRYRQFSLCNHLPTHRHTLSHQHTQLEVSSALVGRIKPKKCSKKQFSAPLTNFSLMPYRFLPVAMRLMGTRCITWRFACKMFVLEAPWPQQEKYATITSFVFSCFGLKKWEK